MHSPILHARLIRACSRGLRRPYRPVALPMCPCAGLDSSIAPKTLTPATLNAISPAWRIPNPGRPLAGGHVPALRLRVMTRRSVREAGTASATGAAPSASAGEAGEDDPNNLTQSCCICIDRFCAGHRVRRLPCKHLFHATYGAPGRTPASARRDIHPFRPSCAAPPPITSLPPPARPRSRVVVRT